MFIFICTGFGGEYDSYSYYPQFSQSEYGLDPISSFSPGLVDQGMANQTKKDQSAYNSQDSTQSSLGI